MTAATDALGSGSAPHRFAAEVRRLRQRQARTLTAYAFMTPSLFILALFVIWPMVSAFRTSFTDYSVFGDEHWIGLGNYAKLLRDSSFHNALVNTTYYVGVTTPISIVLALSAALMLNQRLPGRAFFRAAIFLPFVVSLSIVGITWSFLLNPQIGLITHWLSAIGISTGNGIRDPNWAMPGVILVGVWKNVGFYMVMYLAALQSIPHEVKEASEIDGARGWRRFRHITWPLLANTNMFVFIIATIFAFQAFDQIYVMTGGGPFFKTETLVMQIYRFGFREFQMGYASAISWVLVGIVLALSLLQVGYFSRRAVRY
jgi:ABC-type sugar transport system permease subunit